MRNLCDLRRNGQYRRGASLFTLSSASDTTPWKYASRARLANTVLFFHSATRSACQKHVDVDRVRHNNEFRAVFRDALLHAPDEIVIETEAAAAVAIAIAARYTPVVDPIVAATNSLVMVTHYYRTIR